MSAHDVNITTTDRDAAGVDVARVTDWLRDAVPQLAPPLRFTRIGSGESNLTYRIDHAGGEPAVLRRPPLGEVLQSAHDMAREYHVIERLARVGMPVATPLALCEDATVTGAPFYVMEHVDGAILTTVELARTLSETTRRTAGDSLVRTLARLQSVDLDAAGFGEMRRPRDYCDRQLRRWHRQWEASRTRDLPLVDELAERLQAAMPAEDETVLVHGDYRLDNAVLGPDGEIVAVLDWELCTVGHPLADVGLMIAYWEEAGKPDGLFAQPVTALPGFHTSSQLAHEYGEASGRDVSGIDFFVAFACWKIAIIGEGVHRRWLNDPANGSESASAAGEWVGRLTRQADEIGRSAGF